MSIACGIAKDLLPLYREGLLGGESIEAVEAHLKICEGCRAELEAMEKPEDSSPAGAVPLKAMRRKLRQGKLRIGALAAALVLFFGTLVLYHSTARHYVRYMPGVMAVFREADGSMVLEYNIPAFADIKGYEEKLPPDMTGSADRSRFVYYVTLYNHDAEVSGSGLSRKNLHKGADFTVYYAYPDEKAVLLYGEGGDESFAVLPRLALNYYALLAAAMTPVYALAALLLRRRLRARRALISLALLSLAYVLAHLGIKGLSGASWDMLRDLAFILSAWVFGGIALLIGLFPRMSTGK